MVGMNVGLAQLFGVHPASPVVAAVLWLPVGLAGFLHLAVHNEQQAVMMGPLAAMDLIASHLSWWDIAMQMSAPSRW